MMKKTLGVLVGALLLATAASAVEIPAYKSTPTVDGVISEGEYAEDSLFVMDHDLVVAQGCVDAGDMDADHYVKYHFAWDDDGLYIAAVAYDVTHCYATSYDVHGQDGGEPSDMFQFVFWANENRNSVWFSIGFFENGDIAPGTHYTDAHDLTEYVTGKATFGEDTTTAEIFIPWDTVEFGLTGNTVYNHLIEEGTSISTLFLYRDRDTNRDTICRFKNSPDLIYPNRGIDLSEDDRATFEEYIVLRGALTAEEAPAETEAPAEVEVPAETEAPETEALAVAEPETEAPAETVVTPAETTKAPQTLDIVALMGGAAALSAVLAAKARKKRD